MQSIRAGGFQPPGQKHSGGKLFFINEVQEMKSPGSGVQGAEEAPCLVYVHSCVSPFSGPSALPNAAEAGMIWMLYDSWVNARKRTPPKNTKAGGDAHDERGAFRAADCRCQSCVDDLLRYEALSG